MWYVYREDLSSFLIIIGKTVTLLRPTSFYQNFGNVWAKHIKTRDGWESPIPSAKVAYLDAKDAAEVRTLVCL